MPRELSTRRRRAALVLGAVVLLGACGGGEAPSGPPTTGGEGAWGPLAVIPPAEASGEALIEGTLRVTPECVLLDERGEDVLLIWPADRTRWNAPSRTISFTTGEGRTVTLSDGDPVAFGGGGSGVEEGGRPPAEFLAATEWVAEPRASCVTDTRWFIDEVVEAPDGA